MDEWAGNGMEKEGTAKKSVLPGMVYPDVVYNVCQMRGRKGK